MQTEETQDSQLRQSRLVTRRLWLQGAAGSACLLALPPLLSQDQALVDAIRRMSVMTGAELPEQWAGPTAGLVGVILQYSEGLRQLDLGEVEPATFFVAHTGRGSA